MGESSKMYQSVLRSVLYAVMELADYLAKHLEELRPEEAAAARVLREMIKNQRLG
jgi:hypothetical protein